ncbi:MAG: amidohydrolase [Ardenticatenaceae bacterium]|nr:amidohydrolase [Ardenticatenaceae bacterium]
MRLDFHTHFYTAAYLRAVARGETRAQLVQDGMGRRLLTAGDYSLLAPAHDDPEVVLAAMAQNGIDRQLLSFTIPGLHVEEAGAGVRLARLVNDGLAEVVSRYPDRLRALAALPLHVPEAAVAELERAVGQLGLCGAQLFSNVNGRSLADPSFWPLYEMAEALDVPLFIHPTTPVSVAGMQEFRLVPMAGFLFDTTLAALQLVFEGVMAAFPKLKIVLGNLGGTIPFMAGRVDRGYVAYAEAQGLAERPSTYLKRMFYDTAGMPDVAALQLAVQFAGVEQIVFGTDFPQQIGDVGQAVAVVEGLPVTAAEKQQILGLNGARLLNWG